MNTTDHPKLRLILHSQILGLAQNDDQYYVTLAAFDYAEKHHTGLRKDGVTPEFNHQLNILGFMYTQIKNIQQPWLVLAVILLHDTLEDNNELEDEIIALFPDVYPFVNRISKVRRGQKLKNADYYAPMASCPVCSLAKGADRLHNLTTMVGVIKLDKLQEAIDETEEFVLPMLKLAKQSARKQTSAYELIKSLINVELNNIRNHLVVARKLEALEALHSADNAI
jgi:(p)ppGpp synthase/HD superfamily hydrolase